MVGTSAASAGFVAVPSDPKRSPSSEIGIEIQLGTTGVQSAFYDTQSVGRTQALNFVGSPIGTASGQRQFEVHFDVSKGELSFKLDLDRNGFFEANEQVFSTTFTNPGIASYSGRTFEYLSITGDGHGNAGRSQLNHLTIGGTAFGSIQPTGASAGVLYQNLHLSSDSIRITGTLAFSSFARGQGRPKWDFAFRSSVPLIPEPSTSLIFGSGALFLLVRRLRPLHR